MPLSIDAGVGSSAKRGHSAAPAPTRNNAKLDQHVLNQKLAGKNSASSANLGNGSPVNTGNKRSQSVDRTSQFGAGGSGANNNAHKYGNFPKLTGVSNGVGGGGFSLMHVNYQLQAVGL